VRYLIPSPWNLDSGLFKIMENGTIRYIIHNFLSICHCKYSAILYHFRELTLTNIVTLKSGLGVIRRANLCTICTSLKSTDRGYLFTADSMCLSSFPSTQRAPEKGRAVRYDRSRSFSVNGIGISWKPMRFPISRPL